MTELEKAIKALNHVLEDFSMLKDGTWDPSYDPSACEDSMDNVSIAIEYLESIN